MSKLVKGEKYSYTNIDNAVFFDNRLSAKAKGVLCQMLSLPDNWEYSVEGLATRFSDGKASIRSAITELERYGYLVRKQVKKGGKYAGMDYMIYANPGNAPNTDFPFAEIQTAEIQTAEIQTAENHTQLNTNTLNTNTLNTKGERKPKSSKNQNLHNTLSLRPTLEEIETYISEKQLNVDGKRFFDYFEAGEWMDSKGAPVKNWKQKIIVWSNNNYGKNNGVVHGRSVNPQGGARTGTEGNAANGEDDFGWFYIPEMGDG